MESKSVLQLYPGPPTEHELRGLYSAESIRELEGDRPFVYTNYVTSLDGRIAVPGEDGESQVPMDIANPRDWRLFQELAVQADVLISSGRYLRDLNKGGAQELAIEKNPDLRDLRTWRSDRGLSPFSDFAVISASLDFPIPTSMLERGRGVLVITTAGADSGRVKALKDAGVVVFQSEGPSIRGRDVVEFLQSQGHRFIYNATGPKIHHLLLEDGQMDRVYLTFAARILGGSPFSTIVEGRTLDPVPRFKLKSLYLDPHGLDGDGQLFASYDIQRTTQADTAISATM